MTRAFAELGYAAPCLGSVYQNARRTREPESAGQSLVHGHPGLGPPRRETLLFIEGGSEHNHNRDRMEQVQPRTFDLHLPFEFLRIGARTTSEWGEQETSAPELHWSLFTLKPKSGSRLSIRIILSSAAESIVQIRCHGHVTEHDDTKTTVSIVRYAFDRWQEPHRKAG